MNANRPSCEARAARVLQRCFDECRFPCSGVFHSLLSCSPASDFFRSFNALMAVGKALVQSSGAPLKACLDHLLHFGRQIDRL